MLDEKSTGLLWTYFHSISKCQLWWLILPAGCNFFSAISVIYVLSYPNLVLFYCEQGLYFTWLSTATQHKTYPHISLFKGWLNQCNWFNCSLSQIAIVHLRGKYEWGIIIIFLFPKIYFFFSCRNILSYQSFLLLSDQCLKHVGNT